MTYKFQFPSRLELNTSLRPSGDQVGHEQESRAALKPVWTGSEFTPRLMLPLSLSYDHRVIDGADGARFTRLLSGLLGDIRRLLL